MRRIIGHKGIPRSHTRLRAWFLGAGVLIIGGLLCRGLPAGAAGTSPPPPEKRGAQGDSLIEWQALWDFADPAASEQRFRDLLAQRRDRLEPGIRLEVLTQIARAQGLQGDFDAALLTLATVAAGFDSLSGTDLPRAHILFLLEKGRVLNSSGESPAAEDLFKEAWQRAHAAAEDCLAIDAAHMLGIVMPLEQQAEWTQRALTVAEASSEPCAQRWRGPLYHNLGMTHLDRQAYPQALEYFRRERDIRLTQDSPPSLRIAEWCVAHTLRKMERFAEALAIQRELQQQWQQAGQPSGYVFEEIAECLLALGRAEESRENFRRAYELLRQDAWLATHETERLARLQQLGGVKESEAGGDNRVED